MALFTCRTRDDEDPDTKTKVYISYAPDIRKEMVDEVSDRILADYDYALYSSPLSVEVDESYIEEFRAMNKVVFIIGEAMFSTENRSLFYDLPLALTGKMDLLPVDTGIPGSLIDLFITCCEHIPEEWTAETSPVVMRRTLLLSCSEMAGACQIQKDYENAEKYLLAADSVSQDILELQKDMLTLDDSVISMMNLAVNRSYMEDYGKAYDYARTALSRIDDLLAQSAEETGMKRKISCCRMLGELARQKEDPTASAQWHELAVNHSKEYLESYHGSDVIESLPLSLVRLAEYHERAEDFNEAILLYREALEIYRDLEGKECAPSWLLKEMCSSAMRLFQLLLGQESDDEAGMWQNYAGHLITKLSSEELLKAQQKEERPSTITLPHRD